MTKQSKICEATKTLGRAFVWARDGFAWIGGVLINLLWIFVTMNVILRYFFKKPLLGGDDYAGYMLLFIVFFGLAWVLEKEGHVAIDLMTERISQRKQLYLHKATSVLGFVLSGLVFGFGLDLTWEAYITQEVTYVVETPKWILFAPMAVGWLLLTIQFLIRTIRPIGRQ